MPNWIEGSELPEHTLRTSIDRLGLSTGAYNALRRAGVHVIGQVLELGEENVSKIRYVGPKKLNEIFDSIAQYLGVSRSSLCQFRPPSMYSPTLDTESSPTTLKQTQPVDALEGLEAFIVAGDPQTPQCVHNLVKLITPISKAVLQHTRDLEIVKGRYGLEGSDTYTLQEIGDAYGITRERVRQIESRSMRRIRRALTGFGRPKSRRVPKSIVQEANDLSELLRSKGRLLTEPEIVQLVESRYDFTVSDEELNALRFLLSVFGFYHLPRKTAEFSGDLSSTWVLADDDLHKRILYKAIGAVHRTLEKSVRPLPFFGLRVEVNRRRKEKIPDDYIRLALKACPSVDNVGEEDVYQIRIECLSSAADKAYRVLYEADEPVHIRDICRKINHQLVRAGFPAEIRLRSLRQQLVNDSRFEPIGRSSTWMLSEWEGVRKDTILDLMEEFFHLKQTSATVSEVYEFVHVRRPDVSRQSVVSYISTRKDLFVKTSPTTYELTAWGGKPLRPSNVEARREQLQAEIRALFTDSQATALPLSRLLSELETRTGIPSDTIRRLIKQPPLTQLVELQIDPSHRGAKIARYTGNDQPVSIARVPTRRTWREVVQQEVKSYLGKLPQGRAPVADVRSYVIKTTSCKKHTFYRYLSEMDAVKKEYEDGKLFCYIVEDTDACISFPQIDQVEDPLLRENLHRAIRYLNIENVDLGLFQLGKILERELKSFLLEARDKGAYRITARDLKRLTDMIDCVERNGIIKDKHHLTFLRQERNERAHGEIPDLAKRQRLMQLAPFLAGLFVDYTIFFCNRRRHL